MGITGGLVKSVFSRSWSHRSHDHSTNARQNVAEKRRWNSVRSYLCGDEHNSILAEDDSASVLAEKDSESVKNSAIVTQHNSILEEEDDSGSVYFSEATVTQPVQEEHGKNEKQATIIIQSAFRGFRVRRQIERTKNDVGNGSPNMESHGTSVQGHTGDSVESMVVHQRNNQKLGTLVIKVMAGKNVQGDWDDSTGSSNVSRMRIQNRLEATTRRERALAYAFSQQLRICSKKKEIKSNGSEPNIGWTWLERWMATRLPESSSVESCVSKSAEAIQRQHSLNSRKGFFDATREEKESCGSNEVLVTFDGFSVKSGSEGEGFKPSICRKTARVAPRRKSVPTYRSPKDFTKVKNEGSFKLDFKRQKALGKQG